MTARTAAPVPTLGVGMVGYSFMGAVHSQAWRTAGRFFDLPMAPEMVALCGRDATAVAAAASRFGWAGHETDWKALLTRDDIHLVDVCTPGDTHAEIAIAALEAGKHVMCEKPLANSVAEAVEMVQAAEAAQARGVRSMVAFNYRRIPAVALARKLVVEGRIGTVRHVRAQYLQDWIVDPEFPLVWRLQKDKAGSGALGDVGAHVIDLAQHVTGLSISSVSGLTTTFITERPLPAQGPTTGLTASAAEGAPTTGTVTVDDAALFITRFEGGAVGSFEATRFATGRKNTIRLEVNGSEGSLVFDFEFMNELQFHDRNEDPDTAGFRRIIVTEPSHPYVGAWWPPGHGLGYEHTFTHEVVDLVTAIGRGQDPTPSFADGLQVQTVLAAVERSAAEGTWQDVVVPS
ncbi:Gfo/Idh/MocA family protein [Aquipuribacter hungaricus]|uniref:Gfo/Idh/MocA family protein n=1 Tax=Aquipuribacter hungaricus TaxID=545624 RepID=A0ABV7WGW3_9MICO